MPQDSFELACDRLSGVVDGAQFERLRWARTEGPMLARLVELAQAALEDRDDFELSEEGSGGDVKRFVLKIHGFRIVAVSLGLRGGVVVVDAEAIERARYTVEQGAPVSAEFSVVDEHWMAAALEQVFARIRPQSAQ